MSVPINYYKHIDFLISSTNTLTDTTVRIRVTQVCMDWLVSQSKFTITDTDLTPRWGRLLSGLWALDLARSPLRSRSATPHSALRSRSIILLVAYGFTESRFAESRRIVEMVRIDSIVGLPLAQFIALVVSARVVGKWHRPYGIASVGLSLRARSASLYWWSRGALSGIKAQRPRSRVQGAAPEVDDILLNKVHI